MSEEQEYEAVQLCIQRVHDRETQYNTYHVDLPGADVALLFVLPVDYGEQEELFMKAVFTEQFRRKTFLQFAIDDLERGDDPNAIQ